MSDPTILETLRGVEFLHDIADGHLERLAEIARPVEFPARTEMFHEKDMAKDVYLIVSGRVSLFMCTRKVGCRQLMEVGAGEFVGWSPLVGRPRLSDTAVTLTPAKALAMDGEQLLSFCRQDPEFGFEFMRRAAMALAQRLSATRLQLLDTSGFDLPDVQLESD
jgi:CRP-like cAMP-binding protein